MCFNVYIYIFRNLKICNLLKAFEEHLGPLREIFRVAISSKLGLFIVSVWCCSRKIYYKWRMFTQELCLLLLVFLVFGWWRYCGQNYTILVVESKGLDDPTVHRKKPTPIQLEKPLECCFLVHFNLSASYYLFL